MFLRSLTLRNFRLYEEAQFTFSPKLNVIRGANAKGKTTVLEAIYFLMTGRSFRTAQTNALIRKGAAHFYIEALFVKYGIEQSLRIHCNGKERKISYNNTPITACALLGLLQGVALHPEDISVIKGAPALRRLILNLQLAQADPLYVHYLTRYDQAMRQRNALLRAKRSEAIESWEYEMGNAAAYIICKRAQMVQLLERYGKEYYTQICRGNEEMTLSYKPHGAAGHAGADLPTLRHLFCDQFRRHRSKEMLLGITLTGPHKDDLAIALRCISFGQQETRGFASEGQQRSCIAALRLAEWRLLQEGSHENPLMLVDDFGLSLDAARRQALLDHLATLEQVFITTTEQARLALEEHAIVL